MKSNILLLVSRSFLFLVFQLIAALFFWIAGSSDPIKSSAAYWIVFATLGSVTSLLLLLKLLKEHNSSYKELLKINKKTIGKDLLICLGLLLIMGPIAFNPNSFFANLLLGNSELALDLLMQPIQAFVAYPFIILFPLTVALSELPIYFGYLLPKLSKKIGQWKALFLTSFFLAFQHSFLPFLINPAFFAWRLLMFWPFALLMGLVLKYRPSLLPYLVIIHFLMDVMTGVMYLMLDKII